MLTLDQRDCTLGVKSTTDGKEIDGQEVTLLTLELTNIPLDQRELCVLLGEPHAWGVLYNTGVSPPEPYLKALKTLELREPIGGVAVTLSFGLERQAVMFADVKLSKIKLELKSGGETAMSVKLTSAPALDETFAQLLEHLGDRVEIEMRFEPGGAQQELPLSRFGEGEQPPSKPKRGRPRKDDRAGLN
jgi:hypothetical protein